MKRKLLYSILIVFMLVCLCSCKNSDTINTTKEAQAENAIKQEKIEVELSMDNINEYLGFVSIGHDEWIMINKQYENDMIYWRSDFNFLELEISFINLENEKINDISGYDSFETIIDSIDEPTIKSVKGTITFIKGGKSYVDDKGQRIAEFEYDGGCSQTGTNSTRAKYFNEYPY